MKNIVHILSCTFLCSFFCASANGQIINTIAGNGTPGYMGSSGPATAVELFHPKATATDDSGNVYIADADNNLIRKIDLAGNIYTIAGYPAGGFSGDGGLAIYAGLSRPNSIAIDHAGNIFICDADNQRIRKINAAGVITTIVGNGIAGYNGDGGLADTSEINFPGGIALDKYGNLYITDEYNNRVRKVGPAGIITTFAGNGLAGYSGEGGMADTAAIGFPFGIATDTFGNVFFSLTLEDRICKVNTAGIINTYAGVGGGIGGFAGDGGPAAAASIDNPWGIGTDLAGNLYIADFANERIRKVDLAGNISTVAGTGSYGFAGDGLLAVAAKFKDPAGVGVDATGNIYIADYNNHRVRKVGIANHTPYFVQGNAHSVTVCADATSFSVDAPLSIIDSDNAQLETWGLVSSPVHGSLASAYGTFSSGGTLVPSGLSYTPAAGYIGNDSFKIKVSDGIAADTITVYVKDSACSGTYVNAIPQPYPAHLQLYPNPGNGEFMFMLSSPESEEVTVVATNLLGEAVKEFTTFTNETVTMRLYTPGIYFINATTAHGHLADKVIMTR